MIATVTAIETMIETGIAKWIVTMTVIATEIGIAITTEGPIIGGTTATEITMATMIATETVTGIETGIVTASGIKIVEHGIRTEASGTVADTAMLATKMVTTSA
jgi:hypothetical protein